MTNEDEATQMPVLTLLPATTLLTPVGVAPVATTVVVESERYVLMPMGLPVHVGVL